MKRFIIYLWAIMCCASLSAQHFIEGPLHSADNPRKDWILPGDTIVNGTEKRVYSGKLQQLKAAGDITLQHPAEEMPARHIPTMRTMRYPTYGWGLHEGLNASIGVSAFATFGKHVPHRGGWSQDIDLTYLTPLTKDSKLWIAAGGYLHNTFWGGDSYRDAGLYAMLGYRIDKHWEVYAYGQLSLANNYDSFHNRYGWYGYGPYWGHDALFGRSPMGLGMGTTGANVLGAGAIYHFNPSFAIGISIEGAWYDNHAPSYQGKYRYDYPVDSRNH